MYAANKLNLDPFSREPRSIFSDADLRNVCRLRDLGLINQHHTCFSSMGRMPSIIYVVAAQQRRKRHVSNKLGSGESLNSRETIDDNDLTIVAVNASTESVAFLDLPLLFHLLMINVVVIGVGLSSQDLITVVL